MMRSSANTQTINIPQVPSALVMNFVIDTPEGTTLWEALCQWRTHYAEKQKAIKRLEKLKKPTKTRKDAETEFHKARNRLKRSYKMAQDAFQRATESQFILQDYATELAAIAQELGMEFTAPKRGEQLSLRLNA